MVLAQLDITWKEINLDAHLIFFRKINSKWITDLIVKCKAIKLLEDIIGENLDGFGFGNDFLIIKLLNYR